MVLWNMAFEVFIFRMRFNQSFKKKSNYMYIVMRALYNWVIIIICSFTFLLLARNSHEFTIFKIHTDE